MIANRRIVCRLASTRSSIVTESRAHGSSTVAPISGCVSIVRDSRFSDAMSKYLSTTATVLFHTFSKSVEETTSGLVTTGRGEKIRVTLGACQPEGHELQPA